MFFHILLTSGAFCYTINIDLCALRCDTVRKNFFTKGGDGIWRIRKTTEEGF